MEIIKYAIDTVIHVDKYINLVIENFGSWSYLLLFVIIFCETGLVVTPFLPGDSLLFAIGAFSAVGAFKISWLYIILVSAAIIGDTVNYFIGKYFGDKIVKMKDNRFIKKEYIDKTHKFYERHGGKTIILARFVPIIRTFAPFVAGIGKMNYSKFVVYNITGGILWVTLFLLGGYYFGNVPIIKENFSVTIYTVIIISVLPIIVELWRHRKIKSNA